MPEGIDPAMWSRPDLQPVFVTHNVGALFRMLGEMGIGQRRIAELIGRSQSRVSEIAHGRQVSSYAVLAEIVQGLGIPPERMGLSWWAPDGRWHGSEGVYRGEGTVTSIPKGVSAAMLRRHLIAWGGIVMAGVPVTGVGELLDDLGELPPVSLPSQLSTAHVAHVENLSRCLEDAGRAFGSDPGMSSAAAGRAEQWLKAPGAESVKRALLEAVAHLHIHAGVAAFDGGLYERALYHFARAVELASQAGDAYLQALALNWAGLASTEHGHPNDGLKMLQAAQVAAWNVPDRDQRTAVEACGLMDSATALAALGEHQEAYRRVGTARALWTPTKTAPFGDLDRPAALLEIERGRLDTAEQFAVASVRLMEGVSERGRTRSGIILATIHIKAGEQRGLQLAHTAITDAAKLTSVRTRNQLLPLTEALDARPGSDARELARMARQIAA